MSNMKIKDKIGISLLKIQLSSKKSFGITDDFIEAIYYYNLKKIKRTLKKSKTKEQFLKSCLDIINNRDSSKTYLYSGIITGIFNGKSIYIRDQNERQFIKNDYKIKEIKKIINDYKYNIYEYILNNNKIKNQVLYNQNNRKDLTVDFTYEYFLDLLNNKNNEISKIFLDLLSSYDKKDLFDNKDFVKFELKNNLLRDYTYKSMEERKEEYNRFKSYTNLEYEKEKNKELLNNRIEQLDENIKNEMDDYTYLDYEIAYRKELLSKLYTPNESLTISNYKDVKPMLLHFFIRSSNCLLNKQLEQIKNDVIKERIKEKQEIEKYPFTDRELQEIEKRSKYLEEVLLNPFVTEKVVNTKVSYTDATGLENYLSNTTNQISARLVNPETLLLYWQDTYGIGFDGDISPENIIISSSDDQTTNTGIYNLNENNEFSSFSSPFSELMKHKDTEILLMRNGAIEDTKTSYIFYFKCDGALEEEVQEHSLKNNLKLITFDIKKIQNSYKEYLNELNKMVNEEIIEDNTKKSLK